MTEGASRRRGLWGFSSIALGVVVALATMIASPAYAAAPSNDDIVNAIVVSGTPYSDTVDTSEASVADGDSGCGAATVWYTFTPTTDGAYAFTTIGSDYDTMLALFEGSPGNLTLLACNDDAVGLQSAIKRDLTAGTTYYIAAGTYPGGEIGQVGPGGNLVLNVDVAPAAFEVVLTVDGARIGTERTTAIVSGTVTCNNYGYVSVSGTLRQKQGLIVARGDFYTETSCSSTPTTWTATVDAGSRVFLPKGATVTATTSVCDLFTCDDDSVRRSIKLTK